MSEPSGQDRGYKRFRRDSGHVEAPIPAANACLCEQLPQLKPIFSAEGVCTDHNVNPLPPHVSVHRVTSDVSFNGMTDAEGFEIVCVYKLQNFTHSAHFNIKATEIAVRTHQMVHFQDAYYFMRNLDEAMPIITNGLCNQRGLFGKGIYTTETPLKANGYCPSKGNPNALRVMLHCQIIPGNVKTFEPGEFNREQVATAEVDSVRCFITNGYERVVYDRYQVNVTGLIIYRYRNDGREPQPTLPIPQGFTGHVVYITASLSEFFSKIKERCNPSQLPVCKKLIADLLKQIITPNQFLRGIRSLLNATPPSDLEERMIHELAKSNLPKMASAQAAPTQATPAPAAVASVPVLQVRRTDSRVSPLHRRHNIASIRAIPLYRDGARARINALMYAVMASGNPVVRTDAMQDAAQTLATLATISPSRPGATADEPVVISSSEDDVNQ